MNIIKYYFLYIFTHSLREKNDFTKVYKNLARSENNF